MSKIYNAADVLLDAQTGASPGMPILESQSVGTPVIGTDYSAYPEFVKAGYCAKVLKYFRSPSVPWIKKALPDPYSIADSLEKILNSDPDRLMKVSVEAMKEYTWENTLQGWLTVLELAEEDIETKCLRVPTPSENLQKIANEVTILE
jgi:glycosyltransferase involved in cell wall biosynthesis